MQKQAHDQNSTYTYTIAHPFVVHQNTGTTRGKREKRKRRKVQGRESFVSLLSIHYSVVIATERCRCGCCPYSFKQWRTVSLFNPFIHASKIPYILETMSLTVEQQQQQQGCCVSLTVWKPAYVWSDSCFPCLTAVRSINSTSAGCRPNRPQTTSTLSPPYNIPRLVSFLSYLSLPFSFVLSFSFTLYPPFYYTTILSASLLHTFTFSPALLHPLSLLHLLSLTHSRSQSRYGSQHISHP